MYRNDETHYSNCLQRDMNMKVYGHAGQPFIVFPCQDAMANNFEEFGMMDTLNDYLEEGRIQLFCVDTVDKESWSDENGDKEHRIYIQEQYYYYIVNEVLPILYNNYHITMKPMTMGFSLGATHAAIVYLRRPDLFSGCLGLAGCYDAAHFWDGWMNEKVYNNSPVHFLANMPSDHEYIQLYNQGRAVLSVGQGRWNGEGIRTLLQLQSIFSQKHINIWCDLWGNDVDHDWPWWKIQIRYFLPYLLGETDR